MDLHLNFSTLTIIGGINKLKVKTNKYTEAVTSLYYKKKTYDIKYVQMQTGDFVGQ